MADTKNKPVDAADVAIALTIDEFCARLSANDRRVELIGGFFHSEKAAGNFKDTEDAFQARFVIFVNKPV